MKVSRSAWVGFWMVAAPILVLLFFALPEIARQSVARFSLGEWWAVLRWVAPGFAFLCWWFSKATRLINGESLVRRRVIDDPCYPEGGPLMTRYYLLDSPWLALYVHHFHRSDHDRHVHDHPWSFLAFLLSGGYWEHVPKFAELPEGEQLRVWRRRFSLLWRPAEWRHWVEIKRPVWTLVLRFRRRREWGFWTEQGWVGWQAYGRYWCE